MNQKFYSLWEIHFVDFGFRGLVFTSFFKLFFLFLFVCFSSLFPVVVCFLLVCVFQDDYLHFEAWEKSTRFTQHRSILKWWSFDKRLLTSQVGFITTTAIPELISYSYQSVPRYLLTRPRGGHKNQGHLPSTGVMTHKSAMPIRGRYSEAKVKS